MTCSRVLLPGDVLKCIFKQMMINSSPSTVNTLSLVCKQFHSLLKEMEKDLTTQLGRAHQTWACLHQSLANPQILTIPYRIFASGTGPTSSGYDSRNRNFLRRAHESTYSINVLWDPPVRKAHRELRPDDSASATFVCSQTLDEAQTIFIYKKLDSPSLYYSILTIDPEKQEVLSTTPLAPLAFNLDNKWTHFKEVSFLHGSFSSKNVCQIWMEYPFDLYGFAVCRLTQIQDQWSLTLVHQFTCMRNKNFEFASLERIRSDAVSTPALPSVPPDYKKNKNFSDNAVIGSFTLPDHLIDLSETQATETYLKVAFMSPHKLKDTFYLSPMEKFSLKYLFIHLPSNEIIKDPSVLPMLGSTHRLSLLVKDFCVFFPHIQQDNSRLFSILHLPLKKAFHHKIDPAFAAQATEVQYREIAGKAYLIMDVRNMTGTKKLMLELGDAPVPPTTELSAAPPIPENLPLPPQPPVERNFSWVPQILKNVLSWCFSFVRWGFHRIFGRR